MKRFDYATAVNQLNLGKEQKLNNAINYGEIPKWVQGKDFLELFLPYVKVIGDSREQDKWIEYACKYYGIAFEWAKHDKKSATENLKEGDYTFKVVFGNKEYDYIGQVAYERKGSIAEFYGNCVNNRDRIDREFERFNEKKYKKVVLMLQFGERITDLIGMEFEFRGEKGKIIKKNTFHTLYSTVMSWKQPNNKDFDIIQSNSRRTLFWLFLQDCYYYFRNEIKQECIDRNLIEKEIDNSA